MADAPSILALDFDGVVCDGLHEYFASAWRAYVQLWASPGATAPAGLAERFYALRPVIESGWEMPLLIKGLLAGVADATIAEQWGTLAPGLLDGLERATVGERLDRVRDDWIVTDRAGWLGLHRFYPGIVERLRALAGGPTRVVIITTKEGRFVLELFAQQGLDFPADQIHGKESKRPKADVLRALKAEAGPALRIWFVEDRFKTLQGIKTQHDLDDVRLFLAGWGYNFPYEREAVRRDERMRLLVPEDVFRELTAWP
jgi:phosphoglycolate phosphatase-like HAD superfamily hydrolase